MSDEELGVRTPSHTLVSICVVTKRIYVASPSHDEAIKNTEFAVSYIYSCMTGAIIQHRWETWHAESRLFNPAPNPKE